MCGLEWWSWRKKIQLAVVELWTTVGWMCGGYPNHPWGRRSKGDKPKKLFFPRYLLKAMLRTSDKIGSTDI